MECYTRNVLVVEPNPIERERLAAALEGEGFQAFLCSGPTQPDYTCLGARASTCPLASQDAVVVLDMSLDSDAVMLGTPAEDLLGLYLESGHPVVALDGTHTGDETGRLIRLRRHPETDALLTGRLAAGFAERHLATGVGEGRVALKAHGPGSLGVEDDRRVQGTIVPPRIPDRVWATEEVARACLGAVYSGRHGRAAKSWRWVAGPADGKPYGPRAHNAFRVQMSRHDSEGGLP